MQLEHRVIIHSPPEMIFAIYEDVANWHTWDPDTKKATLDGPFQVGSRGRLTPTKGNTVPMQLTHVAAGKAFTVESKIALFRMLFEHELSPSSQGTQVVHRVSFFGLLSYLLGPMLIRQLNVGLPITLDRLKALAESRVAT